MKRRELILEVAVVCDRCGETIRAGEAAIVEFDEKTGSCRFTHETCPAEHAASRVRRPDPRTPRSLVRGAGRVRSTHNNRKVR